MLSTIVFAAQEPTLKTPDTTGYMVAAYVVIGAILLGYGVSLWVRRKRAKED